MRISFFFLNDNCPLLVNTKKQRHTIISRSLPKLIIIGVMKGGTTSLFYYLDQHPSLIGSTRKEVHFFDSQFEKGIVWYSRQFPSKNHLKNDIESKSINFEASPYYIFHPYALRRIAATIPHVKIIALLRNPVDRAYSHYRQIVKRRKEALHFEAAIAQEEKRIGGIRDKMLADEKYKHPYYTRYSYLARGRYIEQVKEMYRLFPKEQILILKSEELFQNANLVMEQVFRFLNVSIYKVDCRVVHNQGQYQQEIEPEVRQNLLEYFCPYNQQLYEFIGRDFGWQ